MRSDKEDIPLGEWKLLERPGMRLKSEDDWKTWEWVCPYCQHLSWQYGSCQPHPETVCYQCHRSGDGTVHWNLYREYDCPFEDYYVWRGTWEGKRIIVPAKDWRIRHSMYGPANMDIYLEVHAYQKWDSKSKGVHSWNAHLMLGYNLQLNVFAKPQRATSLKQVKKAVDDMAENPAFMNGLLDEIRRLFYSRDRAHYIWQWVSNGTDTPCTYDSTHAHFRDRNHGVWRPFCTFFNNDHVPQWDLIPTGKYLHAYYYGDKLHYSVCSKDSGSYSSSGSKDHTGFPEPW